LALTADGKIYGWGYWDSDLALTSLTDNGDGSGYIYEPFDLSAALVDDLQVIFDSDAAPAACTVQTRSLDQITCLTAAHDIGTVSVTIHNGPILLAQFDNAFAYTQVADPLRIDSITPDHGPASGGTALVIEGSGFTAPTATVTIGDVTCQSVNVVNSSRITCSLPSLDPVHAAETVNVTVDNGSESDTMEDAYAFVDLFLSLSTDQVSFDVAPNGNISADKTVATVKTNNPTGYTLSIAANSADLVCETNNSYQIPGIAVAGALGSDHWGWNWANHTGADTKPNTWRPIPIASSSTADKLITSPTTPPDTTAGDKYDIWFGAKASLAMPACEYRQSLIMTAVGI
jgi:hypothetical protein